mgnify:CR=1 FL=1
MISSLVVKSSVDKFHNSYWRILVGRQQSKLIIMIGAQEPAQIVL